MIASITGHYDMLKIAAIIFSYFLRQWIRNGSPGLHFAVVCYVLYHLSNTIVTLKIFIKRKLVIHP